MRLAMAFWVTLVAMLCATSARAQGEPANTARGSAAAAPSGTSAAASATSTGKSGADSGAEAKPAAGTAQPESGGAPAETSARTTAGPAAGAEPSPSASTGSEAIDGSTYVVRMRDLAQRIDELKEQIRRSHTRLSLLSDTILSGGVGGARAQITFQNDLSNAFRTTRALFVLDGAVQYNKQDETGALAAQRTIPIFSGSIPPGDHTLQVLLRLQGHGYGVFSYLRGYHFEVKSAHSFTVTEGKTIELTAVAWEKGGVTTPLEQRPAIRYVEKVLATGEAVAGPKAPGQSRASGSLSVSAGGK